MQDLLKLVNVGATASPQWIMMFMLTLMMATAAYLARRQMAQLDDLLAQSRQDSLAHQELMQDLNHKSNERSERFAVIVTENSKVISETKLVMDRIIAKI
jgi:hypothetical protein